MTLDELEPGELYHYRITMVAQSGVEMMGETYELDMRMNFAVPAMPGRTGEEKPELDQAARAIIKESGVNRGVCVVYGFGSGELAYELAMQSDLVVFGFDDDRERVGKARKWLYGKGVYGSRVSVTHVEDMNQLPVTGNIANLLVSESILTGKDCPGSAVEMNRLLRPGGGVAILGSPPASRQGVSGAEIANWLAAGKVKNTRLAGGEWFKVEPGPMADSGEWTHQYGNAGNTTAPCNVEAKWLAGPTA